MKKILLSALIASAATMSFADQKTVTFDFSKPANYGYTEPDNGAGTPLQPGNTITSDGVTITNKNTQESKTAVRFYNSSGSITFRLASGGAIDITAGGNKIVKLDIAGTNIAYETNFTATPTATWTKVSNVNTTWEGSAETISIVRASGTVTFSTLTVVYETEGGTNVGETEKYTAISWDGTEYTISDEFKAAVEDPTTGGFATNVTDGKAVVKFGTKSVEVEAVGGTTPKDVQEVEAGVFPGWSEWNDVKWDYKNQGDILFAYINGTGNPVVKIDSEAVVTDGNPTGMWRAAYTYYEADGSAGMPVMGLYYKMTVKETGLLKIAVWSNKGNRNTFVVDEATKQPIKMRAEGYINGQNYTAEDGVDESLVGKKKWLSTDQIQAIHDAAKVDSTGVDSAPYVIGAGNQNFWGNIVCEVVKDQTLWLFQHSSQIGFQGFEFTPGAKDGIESVKAAKEANEIYDILGNKVSQMQSGKLYIKNGRKVFVR